MNTPDHYRPGTGATPWDLQRNMQTCGNLFADIRRAQVIEYCFRIKDDPLGDLEKSIHCLQEAVAELKKSAPDTLRDRQSIYADFRERQAALSATWAAQDAERSSSDVLCEALEKDAEKRNQDLQTSKLLINYPPNPA